MRHLVSMENARIVDPNDEQVAVDLEEISASRIRFWFGLGLAVSSCLFIGASFIIKKKALLRLCQKGHVRAGSGGYGYLREWVWWAGLLSMGLGEALNFAAYALAPASLVTPLGALSVLVSAILAAKYLDEALNLLGKLGCFLCIIGSTVIVIHAPTEGEVDNLEQLSAMLTEVGFLVYITFVIFASFILIIIFAPRYGNSHLLVYILICSLIGSLSVMAVKGLGLAIRETLSGDGNQLTHGLFWLFLFGLISTVSIQMNYLNKALDIFPTTLVTPVYYVFFTTFVLVASNVLYKEWMSMSPQDFIGSVCGFLTVIVAIFLLNAFVDFDISVDTLRRKWAQHKTISTRQDRITDYQAVPGRVSSGQGKRVAKRFTKKRKKKSSLRIDPSEDGNSDLVESGSCSEDSMDRDFSKV